MCVTNTNSSMAVVSSNTSQKPLNPYARPFITSAATATAPPYKPLFPLTPVAVYPHLLCSSALRHPILKCPTKPKPINYNNPNQRSASFKLAHPKTMRLTHKRFPKSRGSRLVLPPRLRIPAPAPAPEKMTWRKKSVSEAAEPGDCKKTSVMMRNIPNQYKRDDLMEFIDKFCLENNMQYDFLYLPMDFKRHNNKGYAFINFTKASHARVFQDLMNGYKWGWVHLRNCNFKSSKTCEIAWAKIQGKNGLVRHFSNSNFPCFTKKYLPVQLSPPRNGSSSPSTLTIVGRCLRGR
ncbi:protein terminal ear1 homolog [Daucus carota subsp. sativus]